MQNQQIHGTRAHASVSVVPAEYVHRRGVLTARIGSQHTVRTSVPMRALPSSLGTGAGVLRAGISASFAVRDLASAPPEAIAVLRWICQHPSCRGRKWQSREELQADHDSDSELEAQGQTHVILALAEAPYVPAKPATADAPAIPPQGFVLLFSNEG
jgi:hypothetical protein